MNKRRIAASRLIGCALLILIIGGAILGPYMVPHDPTSFDHPVLQPPSREYWLGTGQLGQDLFSQLVYGAATSLWVSLAVAGLSTTISVILGLIAGYFPRADRWINTVSNVLLVIPTLLILLIVISFASKSLWSIVCTLGFLSWPSFMRIIRSQVLTLREREFVKAALLFSAPKGYMLRRHILPQLVPTIKTKFLLSAQGAIAAEASLSFLGLGDPSRISWGMILHDAFRNSTTFMTGAWKWTVLPPTLLLILLTVSLALVSEERMIRRPKRSWVVNKKSAPNPNLPYVQTSTQPLLQIHDLSVDYGNGAVLSKVTLSLKKGEIGFIVGESGSGKTTTASAILGLIPKAEVTGDIIFAGKSLLKMPERERRRMRWVDISMVFQDARQSLNPLLTIGIQLSELFIEHDGMSRKSALLESERLLERVQLPKSTMDRYPHEISGGMCSRVLIAMALANKPILIIADEPTCSLDSVTRKHILELLRKEVKSSSLTLLFITHDIDIVAEMADRVVVLKDGKLLEERPVMEWFDDPATEYSKQLVAHAKWNRIENRGEELVYAASGTSN